jgi:ribosome maturation factor RimP
MLKEKIENIIAETARNIGYEIYECTVALKGENTRISVKIDRDGGISHSDCGAYSRELSRLLDGTQLLPNYSLEVSSPGFKRAINSKEIYRRFIGAPVKIIGDIDGKRDVIKGTLLGIENESIVMRTDKGNVSISINNIDQANLDY